MLRLYCRNLTKPSFFIKDGSNVTLLRFLHKSISKSETLTPPPPRSKSKSKSKDEDDDSSSSSTVSYLINSCGLSPQSALSASKKITTTTTTRFQSPKTPDSVLAFFRSNGFTDAQITSIIEKRPVILFSNLHTTIKPKFHLLTSILGSDQQAAAVAVRRNPSLLQRDLHTNFLPNTLTLQSIGSPPPIIIKLITCYPRVMALSTKTFNIAAEKVKRMGFNPWSRMFVYGMGAMASISASTWDKKVGVFKSLGWSGEEIVSAFTKHPLCMLISEKKLRQGMEFFVRKMSLDPSFLARFPVLLMYSLEKRIVPRHSVMSVLISKGLLKRDRGSSYRSYAMSEKIFRSNYVTKYQDQVPDLLKVYKGKHIQEETVGTSKL